MWARLAQTFLRGSDGSTMGALVLGFCSGTSWSGPAGLYWQGPDGKVPGDEKEREEKISGVEVLHKPLSCAKQVNYGSTKSNSVVKESIRYTQKMLSIMISSVQRARIGSSEATTLTLLRPWVRQALPSPFLDKDSKRSLPLSLHWGSEKPLGGSSFPQGYLKNLNDLN